MRDIVCGCYQSPEDHRDLNAESFVIEYSLPKEYSLERYMGPILDQGNKPMCSAITACCNLEWKTRMRTMEDVDLSEEYIFDLRSDKTLEGMTPRDTFKIIYKYGVPTVEAYRTKDWDIIHKSASEHRIHGYARIGTTDMMKNCIIAHGPIYAALPVKNTDDDQFWKGSQVLGGHAVPIIGWTTEGFIIKNSWGIRFGNNGYVILPYEDVRYILEVWTIF